MEVNKIDIYVCTTIFQTGVTNLPWPELLEVVDEFEASGFATMAFPTLFPWVTDGDPTVKGRKAGVTLRKGFVFNYSVLTSPLTDLTNRQEAKFSHLPRSSAQLHQEFEHAAAEAVRLHQEYKGALERST